jgi:hypothetical protein
VAKSVAEQAVEASKVMVEGAKDLGSAATERVGGLIDRVT